MKLREFSHDPPYSCSWCAFFVRDTDFHGKAGRSRGTCKARPQYANLRSFPFMITNCEAYQPKEGE